MKRAAFLRSINVGGRRVKNAQLVAIVEQLGLTDVAAYQAAGNLVFTGVLDQAAIEAGLERALGYPVPVFLRTLDEVVALGAATPFTEDETAASTGKVQVGLLASAPSMAEVDAVLALEDADDRLRFGPRALFWLPKGRMSESTLDMRMIERTLGLQTWRTQGTLQRLGKRFG